MAEQRKVSLRSSDNVVLEVEYEVALQMEVIKNYIQFQGIHSILPVPNVSNTILRKVIQYIKYHLAANKSGISEQDVKIWDTQFVDVDQPTLFDLIMASNILSINNLYEFLCQTVADMIKDLSPEQFQRLFDIKNDMPPEEAEKIKSENAWAFD